MHRSTLALVVLAFGFAGCSDLCGRACGNSAYNRTLADETAAWRYGGDVEALQRAALEGLTASRGHAAPEGCFDDESVCRFEVLTNAWEFRVEQTRGGLRLTATEAVPGSDPTDEPHVLLAAIAIVDPSEAERIRTLATTNGDRARSNTTAKCNRFWEGAAEEP